MGRIGRLRLAVLTLHPIHYQAALWRRLSREPDLEVMVFFTTAQGPDTADPQVGYGQPVEWGAPLLSGYRSQVLANLPLSRAHHSFFCRVNPGLFPVLVRGGFDALFVHSYHNFTQLAAIILASRLGLKVLIRSEPTLKLTVATARRRVKYWLLPWLYGQVDGCMAIGFLNRDYYRHHGVPEAKIFHMPYAVDNDYFFRQSEWWTPRRQELKREYGLPPGPAVLYVGRFVARKRVGDLIRAFAALAPPDGSLALVGSGEGLARCQALAEELGVANVHFLGFRSQTELPRLYALADAFVLPGEEEHWGLVLNEAMCFGLPVMAADGVGAAPDLIAPGENGFIYPVGDIPALTQALAHCLAPGARERLGQASLARIRTWGLEEDVAALRQALHL